MGEVRKSDRILVGRAEIALAGGIKAALDEAHCAASIAIKPRAITAYEAVGMAPADAEGVVFTVIVEVTNEAELLEAIGAGAEAVLLVGVSVEEGQRLGRIARGLRADCLVEQGKEEGL